MKYSNSSLATYVRLSPNHSGPRNSELKYITPHCVVGHCSVEGVAELFANPARQASSNYAIDDTGKIALIVEECNRSWCSSSAENDHAAITCEIASDTTPPYAMSETAYNRFIDLCVDICQRYGKTRLLWLGDKETTMAYQPAPTELCLSIHRWFANKSCVPVESEVLTRNGWVKIGEIQIGDEIACADLENLRITFEEVYDKVPVRNQDTYTNNGFTATKDHRCVYRCHYQNNYRIEDYKHLLASGNNIYIPLAGQMESDGIDISDDELRLMVAVQADGHYIQERRTKEETVIGLEFHLKKERKIERIKQLLKSCGYEYTEGKKADGSVSIRIWGKDIVDECEKYLYQKKFHWDWIYLSKRQADIFLNELLLWDGCEAAKLYTSKDRINLDVVNAIAALNGVGSLVSGNNVQFRSEPFITLGKGENSTIRNHKAKDTEKTRVTCVSVKTGLFLIRQDGKTFITGNCPGDWLYERLGDVAEKVTVRLNPTASASTVATSPTPAVTTPSLSSSTPVADTPDQNGETPSPWATEAVKWAKQNGILLGDGKSYRLHDPVTREEMLTFLHRAISR